jgi:hypothetical protein
LGPDTGRACNVGRQGRRKSKDGRDHNYIQHLHRWSKGSRENKAGKELFLHWMVNVVGTCELFVSHLLWKEIAQRVWKPTFYSGKHQISAHSQYGSGERLCLFLSLFFGGHTRWF